MLNQSNMFPHALAAMLLFGATASAQNAATTGVPLTLNGSAKLLTGSGGGTGLVLTPAQEYEAGSAFTTNAVTFGSTYAFRTFFQFAMTRPGGIDPADGMTFVLQTAGNTALGVNGGDLGYGGITPSVAVEFDTYENSWDINDNHVAILTGGQLIDIDPQTPYGVTNCSPSTGVFGCMSNGDVWSVWIEYDGTTLNVALADNSTTRPPALISYPIDIATTLGQSSAFVGFTAGTGGGWQTHVVSEWSFSQTQSSTVSEQR
jgi:hypothetical protein